MLKKNEVIPADVVILSSSQTDGSAYMQTSNLDGEKTLKRRHSVYETFSKIGVISKNLMPTNLNFDDENIIDKITIPMNIGINVYVEKANRNLYHFEGYCRMKSNDNLGNTAEDDDDSIIPIDGMNFLFKGARIKNTDWVLGLAVYSGKDTKMQ